MVMKSSRYGKFLACSNYPECKGKKSAKYHRGPSGAVIQIMRNQHRKYPEEPCPICGKKMVVRKGRFGKFLACPGLSEMYRKTDNAAQLLGSQDKGADSKPETTDRNVPNVESPW